MNYVNNQKFATEVELAPFAFDTAAFVFEKAISNAQVLEFNPKWSNGTGYFDFAVSGEHAPKIGNGKMAITQTPGGRKILIIGTRLGNVVVFTRYDNWKEYEDPVYVYNMPTSINHAFGVQSGRISHDTMCLLVGDEISRNIGHRIEDIYTLCKRSQGL